MKMYKRGLVVVVAILMGSFHALGQTTTGSISGRVQDESGAVIPGTNVTVTNVDTGISRSVVTDAGGRYRVPSLIPDRYEVQAQMAGFETGVRKGIQLTVGSDLEINMVLKVGQVAQTTVVTAEAPLVETVTGTVSGLVDDKEIRDLPLNGRSFDQLISLQSSAPVVRLKSGSVLTGAANTYAVHGARDQANLYLMDGTELLGAGSNTVLPGGALGINMGVEAIREFSVMTSNYSAAYGKRAGGIINIATRSGTNQLHGSAFEFLRNSALDARNFFDPGEPPAFKRNQFGSSLGGRIRRDRTFFFGTYEGLRDRLGETQIQQVPDEKARQGLLPDPQNPGQFINIGVAPAVNPFLAVFPPPTGRSFGDGTAEALLNPTQVSNQDFYLARLDHQLSDKDSLFARYAFAPAERFARSGVLIFAGESTSSAHVATLEHTRAYAALVNTIRLGFTRSTAKSDNTPSVAVDPSLVFIPGAKTLGGIDFSFGVRGGVGAGAQLTSQGAGQSTERWFITNQLEVMDQVFYHRGAHSLQFGAQVQRLQENGAFPYAKWGAFDFASLANFLGGKATTFIGSPPGADPTKGYRLTYVAGYIQDDYKVRPNFTLNLGLRWEFLTPPTEASGNRISNYHAQLVNGLAVIDDTPTLGSPFYASHKKNFAPRVGFAWDLFGDGKMAVRSGFGMFYDQIQAEFNSYTANNPPFDSTAVVENPPFPFGFSGATGQPQQPAPDGIDPGLDVPTRVQYNLNLQRQITPNTMASIGYVGSNMIHLTRRTDINHARPEISPGGVWFFPANAPRMNPKMAASRWVSADATSSYHGLQLEVQQRPSQGLRYKVAFTYSKTLDSASAPFSIHARGAPSILMPPDGLGLERSLSSFDTRRNLVVNLTYDLPWQNSQRAAAKWIGGWQLSGIVTLSDGQPFTALTGFSRSRDRAIASADRPNLRPGASKNPILGGPDKYFDPSVFELPPAGFYGNLGRNTVIAPGFAGVDFTLVKMIQVKERLKVDFRAEFFNLLNRANFGLPSNSVFTSSGQVRGAAGRITNTVSTSRQIQFGLKLLF